MNGTTVDTLELFDEFKKSFSEEQAHLLSKTLKRVETSRLDALATKRDLAEAKLDLIKWMIGTALGTVGILVAAFLGIAKIMVPGF